MCRLLATSKIKRSDALEILLEMECTNKDGFGYSYLKNGEFVIKKWPYSLSKVLKKEPNILEHLDNHDGWTIIHLRAASHGKNKMENTHPFIINNEFAWQHNGVWSEYNIAKVLLEPEVKFEGETDSEVAAHFYSKLGHQRFIQEISMGGVFMALKKDGTLTVMKTSGDLVSMKVDDKYLLSSELSYAKYDFKDMTNGWYIFNKEGKLFSKKAEKETKFCTKSYYQNLGYSPYTVKSFKPEFFKPKINQEVERQLTELEYEQYGHFN